jgi:hypothetical protein
VGAELFHADGRTDRQTDRQRDRQTDRQRDITKLIDACRNFANAPKILNSWALDKDSGRKLVLREHQRIINNLLRIFYKFCGLLDAPWQAFRDLHFIES